MLILLLNYQLKAKMRYILPLKYVDHISKLGSIRSAAQDLSITPSALNRRIQGLENELGTEIFERLPNGVRLNAAGEILVEHARKQIADLDRVKSQIADLSGYRAGHISIGHTFEIGNDLIMNTISDYHAQFPKVTFSVSAMESQELEFQLSDYQVDIGIQLQSYDRSHITKVAVFPQQVHCAVSLDNPLSERQEIRLYEAFEYPLTTASSNEVLRSSVDKAAARLSTNFSPVFEVSETTKQLSLVANNSAIAFVLPMAISQFWRDRIAFIPISQKDIQEVLVNLVQLNDRKLSVASSKFAESLISSLTLKFPTLDF